ncbi:DKNYY domain-containing protein [Xanthocytophaga flava]|uniref:DKNYY domain-containing protein n=1 Tax=Xanthocytophaga flava TaxID=3048013 RepID=UPI0028D789D5|nr:DKNYY domain-containing protein [Xanthocytophaga flavus]MDJ1471457.1 DKNYY domain-containing protein [Xanthocytophaga flavus]
MRLLYVIPAILLIIILLLLSCKKSKRSSLRNSIENWIQTDRNPDTFVNPIDDTTDLKMIGNQIYQANDGKVYLRTLYPHRYKRDHYVEYLKDITDFLNIADYRELDKGYFTTKGKVYMWWSNDGGHYPVEVKVADPGTFVPFDSIAGGKDKAHVFYGGPPGNMDTLPGADPATIRVMNPKRGCWNCGDCYFVDAKHVFWGLQPILEADSKTFHLVDSEAVDARDKYRSYYNGRPIR